MLTPSMAYVRRLETAPFPAQAARRAAGNAEIVESSSNIDRPVCCS